jgi:Flp pilus assembly protein TadD
LNDHYNNTNDGNDNQSSSISILNKKGLDLLSSASYNESISHLDKALAMCPNDAMALNNKQKIIDVLGKQK